MKQSLRVGLINLREHFRRELEILEQFELRHRLLGGEEVGAEEQAIRAANEELAAELTLSLIHI